MSQPGGDRAGTGRRQSVLRALKDSPHPVSISDLADRLGVHANTVRFHLNTLIGTGQVEQVGPAPEAADRRTAGRPPLMFRPVRGMDPTGARHYRVLADVLTQTLVADPQGSTRAVRAGRAWGRRHAAVADAGGAGTGSADSVSALVGLLDEIGFAPELHRVEGMGQIALRNCPFLELTDTGARVVCPVHLGIMQGALEAWRSPVTVDRLEPFVEPDLCLAHLRTEGAS